MTKKANVLVMGNSGVGKSTLINAVFNFTKGKSAKVGTGGGITQKMKVYENDDVEFRLIDTKGMEYGLLEQRKTKRDIEKWSKESVKEDHEEKQIHMIWYCIDGTAKRVFNKNLNALKDVANLWQGIPIVIVITKSYSEAEVKENIEMVERALDKFKGIKKLDIRDIVPIVSQQYTINEAYVVPAKGISELIECTLDIIPEAMQINEEAAFNLKLKVKKNNANLVVVAAASGAAAVGGIPIPIPDSLILTPLQAGLVMKIIKIYDTKDDKDVLKKIGEAIIGCGVISMGAKNIISGIKAIPGINIAAAIINAVVASIITLVIGEITILIMEKIATGEIKSEDIDKIKEIVEDEFMQKAGKYVTIVYGMVKGKDIKAVKKEMIKVFQNR